LTAPESVSYRAVTTGGVMAGFFIRVGAPGHTRQVTTVGGTPQNTSSALGSAMERAVENGGPKRKVRMVGGAIGEINVAAPTLYESLGYSVTQKLPKYYSNGGDGLLMLKSLE